MKITIGRHVVEVSNYDKILFGKSGITKGEMVTYYTQIADHIMQYSRGHLISLQRFPTGIDHDGFFQKDASAYFPDWITRAPVARQTNGSVNYVVLDKPATLAYLANQGCITFHMLLSTKNKIDKPDRIIFDLDPADCASFSQVQWAARVLKDLLDQLKLPAYCMLTGSRGAHIVIPIKRVYSFEQTADFAHDIAQYLAHKYPKELTVSLAKKERASRLFIDWLRNGFGATAVVPYAIRPLEKAPVAMPISWQELLKKGMTSQKYTLKNALKHLQNVGDVWDGMQHKAVSLTMAFKKFEVLKKRDGL